MTVAAGENVCSQPFHGYIELFDGFSSLPARHVFRPGLADHKESLTMSGERENLPSAGQIGSQDTIGAALRNLSQKLSPETF